MLLWNLAAAFRVWEGHSDFVGFDANLIKSLARPQTAQVLGLFEICTGSRHVRMRRQIPFKFHQLESSEFKYFIKPLSKLHT